LKKGDVVNPGDTIGNIGSTGNTKGPHVHIEVNDKDGNNLDPNKYIQYNTKGS